MECTCRKLKAIEFSEIKDMNQLTANFKIIYKKKQRGGYIINISKTRYMIRRGREGEGAHGS